MLTPMRIVVFLAAVPLVVARGSNTPAPKTTIASEPATSTPASAGYRVGDTAPINYFADKRDALTLTFISATDSNI
jgi:hypothetical protein